MNNVIARRYDEAIQKVIKTGLLPASFLAVRNDEESVNNK
jgi:hypothetical protein